MYISPNVIANSDGDRPVKPEDTARVERMLALAGF